MGKKSIIGNNAREKYTGLDYSSLMSIPQTEEPAKKTREQKTEQTVPEGYKLNPAYIEKRTRRVQLVFQPSLYSKAEAKYKALGYKSLNDYLHSLLEAEVNKEN